ncbi:hypothetical protein EPN81_03795 [Patescibacteria group bacterium]|nr:MAG: hypothetical protein EPN81_03795 [Patescibacteria group bacterium]
MGSGSPAGVFGWATYNGQGGDIFGVLGRTSTKGGYDPNNDATAAALYGEATAASGFSMGAWGETFSSTNGASGVRGVANVTSGTVYGVHGESKSAAGYGVYSVGDLGVTGDKSAIVYTESQGPSKMYAVEATETWFEDFGFGQLQNGYAKISFDPLYLETVMIDSAHPYHVFLQSYDALTGSSLTVRKGQGFIEVVDTVNLQSSVAFSYRVVAKRKYHVDERMEATKVPIDVFMRPDLDANELQQLNDHWEREDYRLLVE